MLGVVIVINTLYISIRDMLSSQLPSLGRPGIIPSIQGCPRKGHGRIGFLKSCVYEMNNVFCSLLSAEVVAKEGEEMEILVMKVTQRVSQGGSNWMVSHCFIETHTEPTSHWVETD